MKTILIDVEGVAPTYVWRLLNLLSAHWAGKVEIIHEEVVE
jgi:hypothetical protein